VSLEKNLSNKFRFFIKAIKLSDNLVVINDINIINQWQKVLRIKRGDSVFLINGQGQGRLFTLNDYKKNFAELKSAGQLKKEDFRELEVCLYLSLLKRDNFELAVQKAVEVGVIDICPVISQRVVKTGWRRDRVEKIATEALEQSGRLWLPNISEPISFDEALEQSYTHGSIIIFDSRGFNIKDYKRQENEKRLNIFVGPEGGFSEEEFKKVQKYNPVVLSLSKQATLRAETAAIVASYWAVNLL